MATSQGMLAGRLEEPGRTAPAGEASGPVHTWPQPAGGRGFSPRLWRLLTAAPGSAARSSAEPARPAPPPAGTSHPQGDSLGPLPAPGQPQGILGPEEEPLRVG